MNRRLNILSVVLSLLLADTAFGYVYCVATVKEIFPNKTTGTVYYKFDDGTAVQSLTGDAGRDENFAVALAALTSGSPIKVGLDDGETCGTNSYTNWTYLVAVKN